MKRTWSLILVALVCLTVDSVSAKSKSKRLWKSLAPALLEGTRPSRKPASSSTDSPAVSPEPPVAAPSGQVPAPESPVLKREAPVAAEVPREPTPDELRSTIERCEASVDPLLGGEIVKGLELIDVISGKSEYSTSFQIKNALDGYRMCLAGPVDDVNEEGGRVVADLFLLGASGGGFGLSIVGCIVKVVAENEETKAILARWSTGDGVRPRGVYRHHLGSDSGENVIGTLFITGEIAKYSYSSAEAQIKQAQKARKKLKDMGQRVPPSRFVLKKEDASEAGTRRTAAPAPSRNDAVRRSTATERPVNRVFDGDYIENRWTLKRFAIPEGTTEIKEEACESMHEMEAVVLPPTLRVIGARAFVGCRKLKSVVIPEGAEEIGDAAFSGCNGLETITLPSTLVKLGGKAFFGCRSLKTIRVPGRVRAVGAEAFGMCESLRRVTLEEGVVELGPKSFFACKSLRAVPFPTTLRAIGEKAFLCCDLWELDLPDGLESVGSQAFETSDVLQIVDLPRNTRVARDAFDSSCRIVRRK